MKRHPTIENGVVIGAGSILIPGLNTIGKGKCRSRLLVVLIVPAGATVPGVSGWMGLGLRSLRRDWHERRISERHCYDVLDPEGGVIIMDLSQIIEIRALDEKDGTGNASPEVSNREDELERL
ncbi:Uncharacterised protein [uncultured archaeon]|nr:Uncharacterised protein [uncultured archaeon]